MLFKCIICVGRQWSNNFFIVRKVNKFFFLVVLQQKISLCFVFNLNLDFQPIYVCIVDFEACQSLGSLWEP